MKNICHGPRIDNEYVLMTLYLVFEHVDQDLATYIERCPPPGLSSNKIKDLMFQILCGIDFLHSHRIMHRDLKPQNILVTSEGKVKIADFGLARTYDIDMKMTSVVVTLWYRSPEVLLGLVYATPVDLWSCGCIMAELHMRLPLFGGTSEADQLDKIFNVIGTPQECDWPESASIPVHSFKSRQPVMDLSNVVPELCPDAKHLLQQMLMFNPNMRVCASDALEHPYFRNSGLVPPAMQQLEVSITSGGHLSPGSEALSPHPTPIGDDSEQSPADSLPI
ncbi:hypothetical protein B566_EDAN001708 [Ephemera danica]|nr:hypothetical protein B566_EDAN001708 [Ephemera danica]